MNAKARPLSALALMAAAAAAAPASLSRNAWRLHLVDRASRD
uniref:Uncharacterized protein n=1 Tax=Rhizophora mucronata TaxID=61149 RepID=A0A2P2QZY7_RHIMU